MNRTMAKDTENISFSLDNGSGVPVYRQIINQIENAVVSGRMAVGDRLPTIRSLAVSLKINPNTIAKAYNELEIRGIVQTQVGSGTYIADKKPDVARARQKKLREAVERFLQEAGELGAGKDEVIKLLEDI
ncbi:putative HTH-type transcriptional regulator YhcF [Spirochaetia bacterium]|nr:putative HTH-type transcriptional regulator YhcF [Spirochaetia bacterium]